MSSTSFAIVAHSSRLQQTLALATAVGGASLWFDDGTLGCERNHQRAWEWHRQNTTHGWAIVLEDDAVPVPDFTAQLRTALDVARSPVVSLYLGTSRPPAWQPRVRDATTAANEHDASWIVGPQLLHAVGVAIHSDYVPALCDWLPATKCPVDQAIAAWAVTWQHDVAYTWPSLVDHADDDTIAEHHDGSPRTEPRKAWRTGTRTTWTSRTVHM
ncbi:hypothetical protein OS122_02585 [Mycolicibacterium mucogenicum]|uniref:hypothetical protein n=1 Tax=Mycolicibacterium mucogenicum TaxID=56689 RepID=UPI00226A3746|nr:hypothetical protein [Mycolicibacterium mucogenicum]MCX8559786.1 hypothetical protein [Mycolicibacterium mucogenicum]